MLEETPMANDDRKETSQEPSVALWEVNEQLLLAGLREHTLAEQIGQQLAFCTAITTSLAEGVIAVEHAGHITFANPAAEYILGWPAGELLGQPAHMLWPLPADADPDAAGWFLRLPLQLGSTIRDQQGAWTHKDGTPFSAAYAAAPIVADARVVGAVITFHDLTAMERLQQERDDYLALMSHDLRAPLTVILGYGTLLRRRLVAHGLDREAQHATTIMDNAAHMNAMIEDVLEQSVVRGGKAGDYRTQLDLHEVVERCVAHSVSAEDVPRLHIHAAATAWVSADTIQLERVISNLLNNALKYSPPTSTVAVYLYRTNQFAVLTITDHGVGIDADELPHIFEKHFRARTAGATAGNGLGLYSSRRIVEAHGGILQVQSEPGRGSTFSISLPSPPLEPG